MLKDKITRFAKPCSDINATTKFYTNVFGFEVLYTFENHDGIDGVILGFSKSSYYMEFTKHNEKPLQPVSTEDDLIVFYIPDYEEWKTITNKIEHHGIHPVVSLNPYWDKHGKTYCDPDGYCIVIQCANWTN